MKKMISVSEDMDKQLREYAKKNSVSQSQIVESAVTLYLYKAQQVQKGNSIDRKPTR